MSLVVLVILILLLVPIGGVGWRYGGPYMGGGIGAVGLVMIILLFLVLSGRI
jgi:hypothetical protein